MTKANSSPHAAILLAVACGFLLLPCSAAAQPPSAVSLPPGVKAVWESAKAFHETTLTRERISINGLWRWQPAADNAVQPPTTAWGYFKVPACWPGAQDYMQSDYQTLYPDPSWANTKLSEVRSAWYERTITIPKDWAGRRIALDVEYLNSYAQVYVDGQSVGEIRFPAGEVDLTAAVRPGATHVLTLMVVAMPLNAVMESYNDTNTAKKKKGKVERTRRCAATSGSSANPLMRVFPTSESTLPSARARSHSRRACKGWPLTGTTSCEPGSSTMADR